RRSFSLAGSTRRAHSHHRPVCHGRSRRERLRVATVVITSNHIYFVISYAAALVAAGLAAKWYLWPAIAARTPEAALRPLLLYACLRVNGLMFLMPGIVSPELPEAFARPVAYGDVTAVLLALIALAALRGGLALAIPAVWVFNLEGTADLLYANI